MADDVANLAHRLAREAEAVCRHYLSNGRRVGNYWQVGDARNTSGRSMFVRLKGMDTGGHPAGKWTEYVAARIMLRGCDWGLFRGRSPACRQHNVSAWRGRS